MSLEHLLEQNKNKDRGITVPDNWKDFSYSSNQFAIPAHYRPYLDQVSHMTSITTTCGALEFNLKFLISRPNLIFEFRAKI